MSKVLIFIFFTCHLSFVSGQNLDVEKVESNKKILDSLLFKVLPTVDKRNPDKLLEIFSEAENYILDGLENYATFIYRSKGAVYEEIGEPENAINYFDKSYQLAIKSNDSIAAARSLQLKGIFYGKRNDLLRSAENVEKSIKIVEENIYNPKKDSLKNKNLLLFLKSNLTLNYTLQKKYNDAIPLAFNTLDFAHALGNKKIEALLYSYIGESYHALEQNNKALEYYTLENQIAIEIQEPKTEAYSYIHIANTMNDVKDQKEMLFYYNKALKIFNTLQNADGIIMTKRNIFKNYRLNKDYEKCLKLAPEIIHLSNKNKSDLSKLFIELGEIYVNLKSFNEAEEYFNKAEKLLDEKNLSKIYLNAKKTEMEKERGKLEKALEYKENEFVLAKQSLNSEVVEKLSYYDSKFKASEKDKQLVIHQTKIKSEIGLRNKILSTMIILFFLALVLFILYKRKLKKKDNLMANRLQDLQIDLTAMELQSLNKQLDPHEIKNMLASISPEIQEKAPESYRKMLQLLNITKASLNNSLTESVKSQVKQIENYLSLKQNSLSEPLEYRIKNKIKNQEIQLPRLILKNLVENSVKHGIKGKVNGGTILVSLDQDKEYIRISVNDTGKGRANAINNDSGIGTVTYKKLFETLNYKNKDKADFKIIDKEEGTKVDINIPNNYKYE